MSYLNTRLTRGDQVELTTHQRVVTRVRIDRLEDLQRSKTLLEGLLALDEPVYVGYVSVDWSVDENLPLELKVTQTLVPRNATETPGAASGRKDPHGFERRFEAIEGQLDRVIQRLDRMAPEEERRNLPSNRP